MAEFVRTTEDENGANKVTFQNWRKNTHGGQMLDLLQSKWVSGQEGNPDVNY